MSYLQAAAPMVGMLAQMSRCLFETAQAKTDRSIFSRPPLRVLALRKSRIPLFWTFKDCSWLAFFTGTLTPAACVASLEQMQPEENKAGRPGG